MRAPENSWEISYVIGLKKPTFNHGEGFECIKLHPNRIFELQEWANQHYTHGWFLDHIKKFPPVKLPPRERS